MSEEVALVGRVEALRPAAAERGGLVLPRLIVSTRGRRRWGSFWSSWRGGSQTGGRGRRTGGRWASFWPGARRGLALEAVSPLHVAAYIRTHPGSVPTVKEHLAAIRMLGDWLVEGQVLPVSPAAVVRGPKHVVTKGATPVLSPAEARRLLEAIDTARSRACATGRSSW